MTIKTRRPTGAVPWPLILVEGGEKAGKSWACAVLSSSERVGETYWLDLGEGSADEYGAVPGANYLIIEHEGTFASVYAAVEEVHGLAQKALDAGGKPVVLVIDSMTTEWDWLKDWATERAKGSTSNKAKLARDPHADINVSANYWNDANSRHRKLMKLLMTFPGIAVMTARGKFVAAIGENGQPVEGKKDYRVESQKTLAFDASCWVRVSRDQPAVVIGARSVHTGIRPGRDEPQTLADDWTLEWLIFDGLRCNPAQAHTRDLVEAKKERSPEQIRDEAVSQATGPDRLGELNIEVGQLGYDAVIVPNERGQDEQLPTLLQRLALERTRGPAGGEQRTDHDWLTGMEKRINDAADRAALSALAREITVRKEHGQCEPVHESHLWTLGKKRQAEIDGLPRNMDGSTSRSRASDEQLAANGEMTKAQLREHNALVKDVYGGDRPADREDVWTQGGPPAEVAAKTGAAEITRPQRSKMMALFGAAEWTDRDDRLRACSVLLGREVTTSNDLSRSEAKTVIDVLEVVSRASDPTSALTDYLAAAKSEDGTEMRRVLAAAAKGGEA